LEHSAHLLLWYLLIYSSTKTDSSIDRIDMVEEPIYRLRSA
jgi:hypothetical protein